MDNFENYAVKVDEECINQDFDSVDLYGERLEEESTDNFGDDIQFN